MQWVLWLSLSVATAVGLTKQMTSSSASKEVFLPGKTTDGHYQIELSCVSCHTEEFADVDDFQAACVSCHAAELEEANDSHPESKFTDPRNADRVALLDARKCVTCHAEHAPERTGSMGLSLPKDYCYQCHQDIAEERPSHEGLPFDSCADAGCHNFHDNRAIYEDYLVKHGREVPILADAFRILSQAKEDMKCRGTAREKRNGPGAFESCKECHRSETESWLSSRHGMRLLVDLELPPMRPREARLPMKEQARNIELSCGSCHGGDPKGLKKVPVSDPRWTQIDACLSCHDDEHSLNYEKSKHYELFVAELDRKIAAGSGVTCATCHLPRGYDEDGNLRVNHNQNHNLRPNEKMVRTTCEHCHGLPFSIDALADPELVNGNFSGQPSAHVKSVDWALARN